MSPQKVKHDVELAVAYLMALSWQSAEEKDEKSQASGLWLRS
jgi:hypothetical protein